MNKKVSKEKKAAKANTFVEVATQEFLAKGIDAVRMTDIASACDLGVATLYRYFSVKKTIVIASGIAIWEKKVQEFQEIDDQNINEKKSGIDSITALMNHFFTVYLEEPNFFVFLRQFDNFCLAKRIKATELVPYEKTILMIKDIFLACVKRGIEDKTVREDLDFPVVYFSFSKAVIGLCQKLIGENAILASDVSVDASKQVRTLLQVLIDCFRRKNDNL
ncbi:MAG: TetR/AcrR family transcriptional regulator [Bacilli bacterium]